MSTNPATDNVSNGGESAGCAADGDTGLPMSRMALDTELKSIISDILGIDEDQASELDADSGLFGHLPELDSMAVAGLLTEMEDRLDIVIDDDDVDGEMLETYGGLLAFAEAKLSEA